MVLCSLFASLTAVCAWIAVPLPAKATDKANEYATDYCLN